MLRNQDPVYYYNLHCPSCNKLPIDKSVDNLVYKYCKRCNLSWEKGAHIYVPTVLKKERLHWIDKIIKGFRK